MRYKSLIIFCLLLIAPFFVNAKSYDFYVDDSASGEQDGSEKNPFKKIGTAIEKAAKKGGSQDVFIEKGDYEENVTIEKSISLYGKDEGKVKIIGTVTMKDDSHLENLTVDGGNFAIVIDADADAKIENCTIEDFGKTGIHSEVGGGKLTVTGSKIRDGEGKGFYIQKGKEVFLSGNEVYENDEEGIDIRSNVDGRIQNNIIRENGESGIELVVGKADLKITDNNIKYNGSSGIATQFYPELDHNGDIDIRKNDIYGNVKYGLDCNIPQGGNPEKLYWSESIEMIDNNVAKNKMGAINSRCNFKIDKVIEDVSEEEVLKEELKELSEEEKLAEQKAEEDRLFEEENNRKISGIENNLSDQLNNTSNLDKKLNELKNESSFKVFFIGVSQEEVNHLLQSLIKSEENIFKIQDSLSEVHLNQEREDELRGRIDLELEKISQEKEFLNNKKEAFSLVKLFGFLKFWNK